jgi:hypothetical protein
MADNDYHWQARALAAEAELEQARAEVELARSIPTQAGALPELERLARVLRKTVGDLPRDEARFLVKLYYQLQEHRIATGNQASHGNEILLHYHGQIKTLEKSLPPLLGEWAKTDAGGAWAFAQHGIGPVLAAGLVAHIDITKFAHVSNLWSFAGYNPNAVWGKGERRPWNAELKVLGWKIGESFVKFHKDDKCYYGHIYRARKEKEVYKDGQSAFAEQAAEILTKRNIRDPKTLAIYQSGHLPAGQLEQRARRFAVKRFLSHFFTVSYEAHFGQPAPKPYVQEHLGHKDMITPPSPYVPLPQAEG